MPVSGIVVTCLPAGAQGVARHMAQLAGVEVHGVLPDGRIVAVVEADSIDGEVAVVTGLQELEQVISVQLAYHNFEEFEAEQP